VGHASTLWDGKRESQHKQGKRQAEGETCSLLRREPNVGLDPRTLGS